MLMAERYVLDVALPFGAPVQPVRRRVVEVCVRLQFMVSGRHIGARVLNDGRRLHARVLLVAIVIRTFLINYRRGKL